MSFLRKAVLVNSTQFVGIILGVVQASLLSRILGPAGIGQYSIIISALMIAAQLFCLGIPISFLYHSQHDRKNTSVYLMNAIWSMLFLGLISGILLVIVVSIYSGYFGTLSVFMKVGIFLYVPVVLQRIVGRNNLMLDIEAKKLSIMHCLADISNVLLIAILFLFGHLSVEAALCCFIFAALVRAAFGLHWMLPRVDVSIKPTIGICRKLAFMGIRQSWADLMIIVNAQVSLMILKHLMGDFESVGFFSRGQRVAMLAVVAGQAVLPMLFSRWASIPREMLPRHVEKVMRFASTIGIALMLGLLIFGKWLILLLFGDDFLPAVTPMMILVPGTVFYLLSRTLMQLLGSQGKPEISAIALFIAALINAALTWILVPIKGIVGAAYASTASNILLLVILIIVVKYKYHIRVYNSILFNTADIRSISADVFGRKQT